MLNSLDEQIRKLQLQLGDATYNYGVSLEELDKDIAKLEQRRHSIQQERDAVSKRLTDSIRTLVQKVRAIQEYEASRNSAEDAIDGETLGIGGSVGGSDAHELSADNRP